MDNQFKESGWAFVIYGSFSFLVSLAVYVFITFLTHNSDISFLISLLLGIFLVFSFLILLCGLQLLKGNKGVHKVALPLSIITLFNAPVGTIVGGLYLWQRFKNT